MQSRYRLCMKVKVVLFQVKSDFDKMKKSVGVSEKGSCYKFLMIPEISESAFSFSFVYVANRFPVHSFTYMKCNHTKLFDFGGSEMVARECLYFMLLLLVSKC